MTAAEIIRALDLKPHPEGGHYRETFRDAVGVQGRAHATAIYYLLQAGELSRWHRIDAAEVWHWYAGAALELAISRRHQNQDSFGSLPHWGEVSGAGRARTPVAPSTLGGYWDF